MTVTAGGAISGVPVHDDQYVTVPATGAAEVNPGDYVAYSGQYAIAVNSAVAYWKASGIGIAMDRNPIVDWAGRSNANSALLVCTHGVFVVTAAFSGQPLLGVVAYPTMTGSAVNGASGVTGVGSTWNTAAPLPASGATGGAPAAGGVAQVINWFNSGPAGTGQLVIRLWSRNSDLY